MCGDVRYGLWLCANSTCFCSQGYHLRLEGWSLNTFAPSPKPILQKYSASFASDCQSTLLDLIAISLFFAYRLLLRPQSPSTGLAVVSLLFDPGLAPFIRCTSYASEPVVPRYASPPPIASLITRWTISSFTTSRHGL
jgi:hypothetical protein